MQAAGTQGECRLPPRAPHTGTHGDARGCTLAAARTLPDQWDDTGAASVSHGYRKQFCNLERPFLYWTQETSRLHLWTVSTPPSHTGASGITAVWPTHETAPVLLDFCRTSYGQPRSSTSRPPRRPHSSSPDLTRLI